MKKPVNITCLIQVRNQAHQLEECIKSVQALTNNIVVTDLGSDDDTANIAQNMGAAVVSMPKTDFVEPYRHEAIQQIKSEWVFILDPDERIDAAVANEIKSTLENTTCSVFQLPRKNFFGKKIWFAHGGWYPDYVTRLIKRSNYQNWPKKIHSQPIVKGQMGQLTQPITHFWRSTMSEMVKSTIVFENMEAELLFQAKRPVSTVTFLRKFMGELWRRMFVKQGFKDGRFGVMMSIYQAFSKTITYLYLFEKYHEKSRTV